MIYEVRTYTVKPGTVEAFESRFAEALPTREKYSKLAAFWHTEIGPLNQVIHVWPYQDLDERNKMREAAAQDPARAWPPRTGEFVVKQEAEVFIPAPFMRPLGSREFGTSNIYEMRTYTMQPRSMPEVLRRWEEAITYREEYSPLVACWYSDLGALNRFVHVWVYKDLNERMRIREQSRKSGHWPPATREWLEVQETKIMISAPFSPVR
ncbi:MAG: NIPSNAP family protein [Dehalococcoidia bacterium]